MQKSKTLNYSENYDPLEHLEQSLKDDGLPAFMPYVKDGIVAVENGRIVMVPRLHLSANAYRDWFLKAFPEGRTEIIRHTKDPVLVDGTFHYPQEVFEVRFFCKATDTIPVTSGWGKAAYVENGEFDEIGTAISKAFKNGMRNMGFGVDLDMDTVLERLPKFKEQTSTGKNAEFIPMQNTPAEEPAQKKASKEQKKAERKADTPDAAAEAAPETQAAENIFSPMYDVLAYLQQKASEEEAAKADIQEPPLEKKEVAPPASAKRVSKEPAPVKMVITDEPEEAGKEGENAESANGPGYVLFQAIGKEDDPLMRYNGMTVREVAAANPSILQIIAKPTFRWQNRISEETYSAVTSFVNKP